MRKTKRLVDKMRVMTRIISVGKQRSRKMEGDLSDKPHQWIHLKSGVLITFLIAVLLVPATSSKDSMPLFKVKAGVHSQRVVKLARVENPETSGPIRKDEAIAKPQAEQEAQGQESLPEARPASKVAESKKNKEQLHAIIEQVASRYNVDPALIKAIVMAESGYNPKAVSKKGAMGLMQLMPSTAQELGVKELFNPKDNVEAGVRYFKQLLRRFGGDVRLALAAYNAGSTKVRRYRGVPPIGATRYYVKKVFHYYRLYKKDYVTKTDA